MTFVHEKDKDKLPAVYAALAEKWPDLEDGEKLPEGEEEGEEAEEAEAVEEEAKVHAKAVQTLQAMHGTSGPLGRLFDLLGATSEMFEQKRHAKGSKEGGRFAPEGGTSTPTEDKPKKEEDAQKPAESGESPEKTTGEQVEREAGSAAKGTRLALLTERLNEGKPEFAVNPYRTLDEVMEAIPATQDAYGGVIDQGEGVEVTLGALGVDIASGRNKAAMDAAMRDYDGPPVVIMGPPKSEARIVEKVSSLFDGDYTRLTDTVRATIAVNKPEDLPGAITAFVDEANENGWEVASQVEDLMTEPLPTGYRDLTFNVRDKASGALGEIQFNLKAMMVAKDQLGGHDMYEKQRSIIARADIEQRPLDAKEQGEVDRLDADMKSLYTEAWRIATDG